MSGHSTFDPGASSAPGTMTLNVTDDLVAAARLALQSDPDAALDHLLGIEGWTELSEHDHTRAVSYLLAVGMLSGRHPATDALLTRVIERRVLRPESYATVSADLAAFADRVHQIDDDHVPYDRYLHRLAHALHQL